MKIIQILKKMQQFKHNLSRDSSGTNLECDFVVKNAFAKAKDIEHRYTHKFGPSQSPVERTERGKEDQNLQGSIDAAQKQCMAILSQKQNEFFGNHHPLPYKEQMALWYDAKAQVSHCFEDLKYQATQLMISSYSPADPAKQATKLDKLQQEYETNERQLVTDRFNLAKLLDEIQDGEKRLSSPFSKQRGQYYHTSASSSVLSASKSSQRIPIAKSTRLKPSGYPQPQPASSPLDQLKSLFEVVQAREQQQSHLKTQLFQHVHHFMHSQKPRTQLNELSAQNEQLFQELQLCKDRFTDMRVENTKLREQIVKLQHSESTSYEAQELCQLVSQFMHAMRQLQKAVNRKAEDVTEQKVQFESAKNELQSMVAKVKEQKTGNQSASVKPVRVQSENRKPTVSSSQLQKLPALLQNVKNLQLEKQKLQELITELKACNQLEQEQLKQKLTQYKDSATKHHSQCQSLIAQVKVKDQLLVDLKQQFIKQPQVFETITRVEQHYLAAIKEFRLREDPAMCMLRQELTCQITAHSQQLESKCEQLKQQLAQKEDSLQKVKLLFISKLHELESSFTDISTQVVEQHTQQQQSSSLLLLQNQQQREKQLSSTVETVLARIEHDEREQQIELLIQANQSLQERLEQQRPTSHQQQQANASTEFIQELQEQCEQLQQQLQEAVQQRQGLEQQESVLKKELQGLKYESKRLQFDLKDAKERAEKSQKDYQTQFNALKQAALQQKQAMDQSQSEKQQIEKQYQQLKRDLQIAAKAFEEQDQQRVQAEESLAQAEERCRQWEQECQSASEELDSLKLELQQTVEEIERRDQQHQEKVRLLLQQHQEIVEGCERDYQQQMCEEERKHELQMQNEIKESGEKCQAELEAREREHQAELEQLVQAHQAQVEQLISQHSLAIEQLTQQHQRDLQTEVKASAPHVLDSDSVQLLVAKHISSLQSGEAPERYEKDADLLSELLKVTQDLYLQLESESKACSDRQDIEISTLRSEVAAQQQKFTEVQQELLQVKQKCEEDIDALKRVSQIKSQEQEEAATKIDAMASQLAQLNSKLEGKEAELLQCTSELNEADTKLKVVNQQMVQVNESNSAFVLVLQQENSQLKEELAQMRSALEEQVIQLEAKIAAGLKFKEQIVLTLQQKLAQAQDGEALLKQQSADQCDQIAQVQKELTFIKTKYEVLQAEMQQLSQESVLTIEKLTLSLESQQATHTQLQTASNQELSSLQNQITLLKSQNLQSEQDNTSKISELTSELREISTSKAALEAELQSTLSNLATLQSKQSQAHSNEASLSKQSITLAQQLRLVICLHGKARSLLIKKLSQAKDDFSGLQTQLAEVEGYLNEQLAKQTLTHRSETQNYQSDIAQLNKKISQLQQDYLQIEAQVSQHEQLKVELHKSQQSCESLQSLCNQLAETVKTSGNQSSQQVSLLQMELAEVKQKLNSERQTFEKQSSDKVAELSEQISILKKQIDDLEILNKNDKLQNNTVVEDLKSKLDVSQKQYDELLQRHNSESEAKLQKATQALNETKEASSQLQGKYDDLVTQKLKEATVMKGLIETQQKKVKAQTDQISELQSQLHTQQEDADRMVKELTAEFERKSKDTQQQQQSQLNEAAACNTKLQSVIDNLSKELTQVLSERDQKDSGSKTEHDNLLNEIKDKDSQIVQLSVQIGQLSDQGAFVHTKLVQQLKEFRLVTALMQHLKKLMQAELRFKAEECENLSIFTQTLEQNAQDAEFRQVQLEGDLKTSKDQLDSLNANLKSVQSQNNDLQQSLQQQESITETVRDQLQHVQADLVDALTQLHGKETELEKALEGMNDSQVIKQYEEEISQAQEQILDLKIEIQKLKDAQGKPETGRNSWGSDGGHRNSWGSAGASTSAEVEEHLKHIRSIMIQFLSKLPFTTKENEDILPILFSMLNFSDEETSLVTTARDTLNKAAQQGNDKGKKGFSGLFNKKK